MRREERFRFVLEYFRKNRPEATTELNYSGPYELVVATILSAQCTDKRVNLITPGFFKAFPDAASLAKADPAEVFSLIRSCSYPNNKTKNLIGMAQALTGKFGGVLPREVEELQTIPGIGRKTANVLASVIYRMPVLAVDTHVFRVVARIGLTHRAKTPLETERQLVRFIPEALRPVAHHWLILHGRYICTARNPKCGECGIRPVCKFYERNRQA
jgi:endonuclease III